MALGCSSDKNLCKSQADGVRDTSQAAAFVNQLRSVFWNDLLYATQQRLVPLECSTYTTSSCDWLHTPA